MNFLKPKIPSKALRDCFAISLNERIGMIILGIVLCSQICVLTPTLPQMLYYVIFIFVGSLILAKSGWKHMKVYTPMMCLWGIMWLSIIVNYNYIPLEYRVIYRNISFFLVMLGPGPFFTNYKLLDARYYLMNICNLIFLIMVIISFVGYFLHLFPSDIQGYYRGCIRHSMTMGCVSGVTMTNCLHEMFQHKGKMLTRCFLGGAIASFFTGLAAASRTSLGASLLACMAYFLICYKGHYSRALIMATCFFAIMIISVNYTNVDIYSGLKNKMQYSYSFESGMHSRMNLWEDRLNEFVDSPIFGVGAHSIRPELCKTNQYNEMGMVEPGNAWLFFLSSTGILGFVVFVIIYFSAFHQCWTYAKPFSDGALLFAQLVYFGVYMNAEAHITASGDYSFMYFWMLIAMTLSIAKPYLRQNRLSLLIFWEI